LIVFIVKVILPELWEAYPRYIYLNLRCPETFSFFCTPGIVLSSASMYIPPSHFIEAIFFFQYINGSVSLVFSADTCGLMNVSFEPSVYFTITSTVQQKPPNIFYTKPYSRFAVLVFSTATSI